ncbi:MAG: hypothetical protein MH321_06100 [Leptospiraceae bacterium]|nr:hypothetical protein [Leptospiraceae bacterium]
MKIKVIKGINQRELLIQGRKSKLLNQSFITILVIIFFICVSSDSIRSQSLDKDSSLIRFYINKKDFIEAKNVLTNSSIYSESSPQYELLETEIWIEEAEFNYKNGNFKTSYDLFQRASSRWSTHPLVRERLGEMKNKILKDNKEIVKSKLSPLVQDVAKEDNIDQWNFYNQELLEIRVSLQKQEEKYWYLLFLFSSSTLLMLFIFIIVIGSGKKNKQK